MFAIMGVSLREYFLVIAVGCALFCAVLSLDTSIARADESPAVSAPSPSSSPEDIPTLEPAPRIEMHEFDAFRKKGTGSISGSLDDVATKAFGRRRLTGQSVYVIPQTSYSQYVADQAREVWLHSTPLKFDQGVMHWLLKFQERGKSVFKFSNLPAGTYIVFADLVDSKASTEKPCVATYAGYDADGNPANVSVGVYCYGRILHDYLFLSGVVAVPTGSDAVVTLKNTGEIVR